MPPLFANEAEFKRFMNARVQTMPRQASEGANSAPRDSVAAKRGRVRGKRPTGDSEAVLAPKRGQNKWEAAYETEVLAIEKLAGLVEWFKFEGLRLKLANGAWFKPDFAVVVNGKLEFREVKGFRRESAICTGVDGLGTTNTTRR